MINIQGRFQDASLSTAEANPEAVAMMDDAVIKFLRDLEQHYKQSELATAEGKLMGNYAVGSETKLEIYLKALYVIQAYDAWRQRLERGSISEGVPIEDITGPEEPGRLSDIEKIEADESMLPKVSSSRVFMLKIANVLDESGMSKLADKIKDMEIKVGKEGLDNSHQQSFPDTVKCVHCNKDAEIAFTARERGHEIAHLHNRSLRMNQGADLWPHDSTAFALYLCKKCLEPTALFNQA
jgi:hypothetical protein